MPTPTFATRSTPTGRLVHGAAALALALAVTACADFSGTDASPTTNDNSMPTQSTSHDIAITKHAVLPGDIETVFKFIAAQDVLPKILTGYGPLPGVIGTSDITGPWDVPGSSRVIHLKGGGTAREQVTEYQLPGSFKYRVWDFDNAILKTLVTGARGEWTFKSVPGGTEATWTYTFSAKNGLTAIPMSFVGHVLWAGYMEVCLKNSRAILGSMTSKG